MTVENPIPSPESAPSPVFCPACGADLAANAKTGGRSCRACGLVRHGTPKPASLANAPQVPKGGIGSGVGAALVGRLETSEDPAAPLLAVREALGPGGVLYLEIGTGGIWEFPKKSLMLLMERCGFRLVRKLDRDGRRGLYRRY